jgi:ubiquinone/menaquinone biosynthesis C-methylase UbiE
MDTYEHYIRFAEVYAGGPYPAYSAHIAEVLPGVLKNLGISTTGKMLDLACGEGTFAVSMAANGWDVTGVDASFQMLSLARQKAEQSGVSVEFINRDMRHIEFKEQFDLVTCWYDSLNYMLRTNDLRKVFSKVNEALKPGGYFIFDMNTIYHLTVGWQRHINYIQQDTPDLLEVHRNSFDYETQVATVEIICFIRRGEFWERFEEKHQERGYQLEQIHELLDKANFKQVVEYSSLSEQTPVDNDSTRVFLVTRKVTG